MRFLAPAAARPGGLFRVAEGIVLMNGREIMLRTLAGQPTPRVACAPLAVHFCAADAGVPLGEYSRSAQRLAECVVRYFERYRPDAVVVSADTWVTAEAMGAPVRFADDAPPSGHDPIVSTAADLESLPAPDPAGRVRQPMMLEALARVREAVGGEAAIIGCFDQSPFTLAGQLAGMGNLMMMLTLDPPLARALIELCVEHAAAYGIAMAEAGADMLTTGDSAAVLIGPARYEQWALPAERAVFARIRARSSVPLSLHICGQSTPLLGLMAQSGADVLELDHAVDLGAACRAVPESLTIMGNIDPVGVILEGDPAGVAAAAAKALSIMEAAGRSRFILGTGCTLAPATPAANVQALLAAAGRA